MSLSQGGSVYLWRPPMEAMLLVRCPSRHTVGCFLTGNHDFPLALSQLYVLVNPQALLSGHVWRHRLFQLKKTELSLKSPNPKVYSAFILCSFILCSILYHSLPKTTFSFIAPRRKDSAVFPSYIETHLLSFHSLEGRESSYLTYRILIGAL